MKDLKLQYLKELENRMDLQENLPHLYGWKWYQWAYDFAESLNRNNFLCAANQISKSSSAIRKNIRFATDPEMWERAFPSKPNQFWYFYPSYDVATIEFDEKWVKEFLPRGHYKDHKIFGWTAIKKDKHIHAIEFNSGVTIYFKSYEQGPGKLQTASVHMLTCDEECPEWLYDEINIRRSSPSINGIFNHVFTATLGQSIWRETIQEVGTPFEKFIGAFKRQVSMYDCLFYMDGTPSPWTTDHIRQVELSCKSQAEIDRRVKGLFVVDEDLKYPSFSKQRNLSVSHPLPKHWSIYTGVDVGSGGKGHPAAITFLAVNQTFTKGRVFKCWRGDGIGNTTASDILAHYLQMRGTLRPVIQTYDWQSKDFHTIAGRANETFIPADKRQDHGEGLLNSLFKNGMLSLQDSPEARKMVNELETLRRSTDKAKAKDDLIDSLRFAAMAVPWDFSAVLPQQAEKAKKRDLMTARERFYAGPEEEDAESLDAYQAEFDEANELYDVPGDEGVGRW